MNIGIACYPTYGGSGVIATELGKALVKRGHSIHIISYRQPARLNFFNEKISFHEVTIPNYPLFEYPLYESTLASTMVDVAVHENLDILHVHYAIPHAAAAYMAKNILREKGIDLPVITTLHGTDITLVGKHKNYEPVVTFSINHSNGVTAVSQSLKSDTYKNFDIKSEIEVIPNFIDLKRFNKVNKDHFRKAIAPNGEKILIHTSNFRKVKRVQDVVKVFNKVAQQIPTKLLLVGDGPERNNIEELCRQLDTCADIRFLGKQEAVEELLAVADLFIMPSESESFGLAALEAMACQLPVISSNTGGIPEINIQGKTGFLSEVGNIEEMAKNTVTLLSDEKLLKQFSERAYQQAQKFDIDKIMPLYEAYYEKILSQKNIPARSI